MQEIVSRLGPGESSPRTREPQLWLKDLESDSSDPLDVQIGQVKEYLLLNSDALREISKTEHIDLVIGWTPRSPQDGILLDSELLAMLAGLNAEIFLDTYVE